MKASKLDFNGQSIYVGFDVHLKSWTVTIMTDHLTHKTFSQPPKPQVLHQYLLNHFPGGTYHSAYEAGFCGYWIHNSLKSLGIHSMVVNAADIPTTHKEKCQKEDSRDSRKIARSLKNGELKPIHVPSLKTLEDRTLVRMRATLVKDLAKNKNRVKSILYFHGIELPEQFVKNKGRWSNRFVKWLEGIEMSEPTGKQALESLIRASKGLRTLVLDATRQIRQLSKTAAYEQNVTLLTSIPGIGLITAMVLLTELETIDRFKNFDHLASFMGLVPTTHSSGEKEITGDITPRTNKLLRSTIIESSWTAVRHDPALLKSFSELCKRMEPNKAIIRIARKLLNRIRHVLKNKESYVCAVVQ